MANQHPWKNSTEYYTDLDTVDSLILGILPKNLNANEFRVMQSSKSDLSGGIYGINGASKSLKGRLEELSEYVILPASDGHTGVYKISGFDHEGNKLASTTLRLKSGIDPSAFYQGGTSEDKIDTTFKIEFPQQPQIKHNRTSSIQQYDPKFNIPLTLWPFADDAAEFSASNSLHPSYYKIYNPSFGSIVGYDLRIDGPGWFSFVDMNRKGYFPGPSQEDIERGSSHKETYQLSRDQLSWVRVNLPPAQDPNIGYETKVSMSVRFSNGDTSDWFTNTWRVLPNRPAQITVLRDTFKPGEASMPMDISNIFSIADPDGDVIDWVNFNDQNSEPTSGWIMYNGVSYQGTNLYGVPYSDLNKVKYIPGIYGTSDVILVGAHSEGQNSDWFTSILATPTPPGPTESQLKPEDLTYTKDPEGKPFTRYDPKNREFVDYSAKEGATVRFEKYSKQPFSKEADTLFYIHGWNNSPISDETYITLNKIVRSDPTLNVYAVDWSALSTSDPIPPPIGPASAIRQVGKCVADAIIKLGLNPDNVGLAGHSLGAYVASEASWSFYDRTNTKILEVSLLDPATGLGSYDLEAVDGNYTPINPLTAYYTGGNIDLFSAYSDAPKMAISQHTLSMVVSDLSGPNAISGDNDFAAAADSSILVQFEPTYQVARDYFPGMAYHQSVPSIYADLIEKGFEPPTPQNSFDTYGKPGKGPFDAVIVAPQPWISDNNPYDSPGEHDAKNIKYPNAIGLSSGYQNPQIHGSASDDIIFYNRFLPDSMTETWYGASNQFFGYAGDDIFSTDQPPEHFAPGFPRRGTGIDFLTGGPGKDTYYFGYKRGNKNEYSYDERSIVRNWWQPSDTPWGTAAYARITDFNIYEDKLVFPWAVSRISFIDSKSLNMGPGIAIVKDYSIPKQRDVIVHLANLSLSDLKVRYANGYINIAREYQIVLDIDNSVFSSRELIV